MIHAMRNGEHSAAARTQTWWLEPLVCAEPKVAHFYSLAYFNFLPGSE